MDRGQGGRIRYNFPISFTVNPQGCVDEHPRCPEWARAGHCVTYPNTKLMAVTCRESRGVCGFLSPFSREEQVSSEHSAQRITGSFIMSRLLMICPTPIMKKTISTVDMENSTVR